jgi:hypothetical protein
MTLHVLIPPTPFSAKAKKGEPQSFKLIPSPSLLQQRGGKEGGEYMKTQRKNNMYDKKIISTGLVIFSGSHSPADNKL